MPIFVPGQAPGGQLSLTDIINMLSTLQGIGMRSRAEKREEEWGELRSKLEIKKQQREDIERARRERYSFAEEVRKKTLFPLEAAKLEAEALSEQEKLLKARNVMQAEAQAAETYNQMITGKITPQQALSTVSSPDVSRFAGESKTIGGILRGARERVSKENIAAKISGLTPAAQGPEGMSTEQKNILDLLSTGYREGSPLSSKDITSLLARGGFIPSGQKTTPDAIKTLEYKIDKVNKMSESGLLPEGFDTNSAILRIIGGAEPRDIFGEFLDKQSVLERQRLDRESRNQDFMYEMFSMKRNMTNEETHNKGLQLGRALLDDANRLHQQGVDISRDTNIINRLKTIENEFDPQGSISPAMRKELQKTLPTDVWEKFMSKVAETTGGLLGVKKVTPGADLPSFQPTQPRKVERSEGEDKQLKAIEAAAEEWERKRRGK